jgi:hypothetical protein
MLKWVSAVELVLGLMIAKYHLLCVCGKFNTGPAIIYLSVLLNSFSGGRLLSMLILLLFNHLDIGAILHPLFCQSHLFCEF